MGVNFKLQRRVLQLLSFAASFKKNCFELRFYIEFCHDFIHARI